MVEKGLKGKTLNLPGEIAYSFKEEKGEGGVKHLLCIKNILIKGLIKEGEFIKWALLRIK